MKSKKCFPSFLGKSPVQAALAEDQNGDQRTQAGQKSVEEIVLLPRGRPQVLHKKSGPKPLDRGGRFGFNRFIV